MKMKATVTFEFPESFELPELIKKDIEYRDAGKGRCDDLPTLKMFLEAVIAYSHGDWPSKQSEVLNCEGKETNYDEWYLSDAEIIED
jgi:hypothetical protein